MWMLHVFYMICVCIFFTYVLILFDIVDIFWKLVLHICYHISRTVQGSFCTFYSPAIRLIMNTWLSTLKKYLKHLNCWPYSLPIVISKGCRWGHTEQQEHDGYVQESSRANNPTHDGTNGVRSVVVFTVSDVLQISSDYWVLNKYKNT